MKKIFAISIIFLICAVGKTATDSNNTIVSDSNNTVVSDTNTTVDCQERIKQLERVIKSQEKRLTKITDAFNDLKKQLAEQIKENERLRALLPQNKTRNAVDSDDSNKWSGFRGLKWGVNIKDMNDPNMILIEEDKKAETAFYKRVDDKLFIGRAELSRLTYNCYKGRFDSVMISTKGYSNFQYLKDAIFAYYGEGDQLNKYIERWFWGGAYPKGIKDVGMSLQYNKFSEEGLLAIFYLPIKKEKEADDNTAAKEADKDFK
ncbi:MAG: hypothetical protein ABSE89_08615 [Sedimentisphaerales bacterium]